tara:strand:+ start:12359 stop:13111 length:753 start_codon:yes stop_codon:yes gene_type:complete
MDQFPNINLEIQNSNVYVYTMPYNYNNTERRTERRRNSRHFSRQTNSQNTSNEQPNLTTSQDVSQNNMSNQSSNIDNSANSTNSANSVNIHSQINNPNRNSVENQRSTLITPTQINNQNLQNNPPNNPTNNWTNPLNQYLDSSGTRNPLMNIAEALQSTFHIPVEQLHFEIIDNLPQRGSSINSLLDSTTLSLASQIMSNENDTCAICRQVYNSDDIVRKINMCGHFFHSSCIEQWLRNNNNCPVCRIGI